ncbi:MAG TPA: hypothetical protein VH813_11285 [Candidatus Limnocylindrales bacterium]
MSRYERRIYFDRLCELRAAYEARGADDDLGSHAIHDVIRDAELALDAIEAAIHLDEAPSGTGGGEEPSR